MQAPHFFAVTLAALAAAGLSFAADPAKVDLRERHEVFVPAVAAQSEVKPQRSASRLLEQRVTPSLLEKREAAVGDRRVSIELQERNEKDIRPMDRAPVPAQREMETSGWSGQRSRFQTGEQTISPPLVARYRDRMAAARTASAQLQPTFEREASFASLNRFVYRRNREESESPPSTPAGGGGAVRTR